MAEHYVVVELQNGNAEEKTFTYPTKEEAEEKYCDVRKYAVRSEVETHTIMLINDEGFVYESMCYKHKKEQA